MCFEDDEEDFGGGPFCVIATGKQVLCFITGGILLFLIGHFIVKYFYLE